MFIYKKLQMQRKVKKALLTKTEAQIKTKFCDSYGSYLKQHNRKAVAYEK